MSKEVLISIKSKWCEKIISREKTVEVRKRKPTLDTPFRCYIYCTVGNPTLNIPISDERLKADVAVNGMMSMNCPIGNGKVIGEFACDWIKEYDSAFSEWAYQVAPPGSVMPMHEEAAFRMMYDDACLTPDDIDEYFGDEDFRVHLWHISDLVIYDEPKTLKEMRFMSTAYTPWHWIVHPPQGWCYAEKYEE